jgi:hypothetical protein
VLPSYAPMTPMQVAEPFHRDGRVYEEKVDDWRILAYKDGPTGRRRTLRGRWRASDPWEHIDFARGMIVLDGRRTKSGKGRIRLSTPPWRLCGPMPADRTPQVGVGIHSEDRHRLPRGPQEGQDSRSGVTFHALRHTFASHYVMRGGSPLKLQVMLGQSSVRVTEIYAPLGPGGARWRNVDSGRPGRAEAGRNQRTVNA